MKTLRTGHGELALPAFLPDATKGVVRALDSNDLVASGVDAVMVNLLHLSSHPGASVVSALGGIHRFMDWKGPVVSDSGGFQILSRIAESRGMGSVSRRGLTYRLEKGQATKKLTPEVCIRRQLKLDSDVLFCLDHCTRPEAGAEGQRDSVENTVEWARRSKDEFERQLDQRTDNGRRPHLFAVVQGGNDLALRRECAERLVEIGFDGYGFGGWPVDREGVLLDTVEFVSELLPEGAPRHGLGIGKPQSVVRAFQAGYDLFDCVIPTRDARHRRLYVFEGGPHEAPLDGDDFYRYVYIQDKKHIRDDRPIEDGCDCACCQRFSRAYLHHLFAIGDHLAPRLATIHNLRFYTRLMARLRMSAGRTEQHLEPSDVRA